MTAHGRMHGRRIAPAAVAGTLAALAGAAPASALSPPAPPPTLTAATAEGGRQLLVEAACNDTPTPPIAVAAACAPPEELAPTLQISTPGTIVIFARPAMSPLTVTQLRVGPEAVEPAPRVGLRGDGGWGIEVDEPLPDGTLLAVRPGSGPQYYAKITQPPAFVAIQRAGLRGRTVTAVVRPSAAGEVSAYVTVGGRRRSAVVRSSVTRPGTIRLQVTLAHRPGRALRADGKLAVRLTPAVGGAPVRGSAPLSTP